MLRGNDHDFYADIQHLYAEAKLTSTPIKLYSRPTQSVTAKEQQILETLEFAYKASLDGHHPILAELVLLASKLGHVATVSRYIEEHRRKLTLEDRRLYTQAMWWACEQRPRDVHHEQIFWMLLDAGADIDASVGPYETPLVWSIKHQSRTKFDVLLARGANVTIGEPLWVAASGRSYFVKALLDKENYDLVKLVVALRRAAVSDRPKNASLLLDVLAEVRNDENADMIDAAICAAFHAAAAAGSEAAVKTFLKYGISVNVRDKSGHTVLATAAFHGQTEIVGLLLKRGADVNTVNHLNVTPLMMAVVSRNRFTVETLLEAESIRLDICNSKGYTAGALASARGYPVIAGIINYAAKNQLVEAEQSSGLNSSSSCAKVGFFSNAATQSDEDMPMLPRYSR